MQQIVRTLTMADASVLIVSQVLICDRDRKWSHDVRRWLREAGIRVVLIPERAPNANAYAERFVRSIKEECLDRIVPCGERHFRRAVAEYVEHYHGERNHQGLGNRLIAGPLVIDRTGRVRRHSRLGGLLNFYERGCALALCPYKSRSVELSAERGFQGSGTRTNGRFAALRRDPPALPPGPYNRVSPCPSPRRPFARVVQCSQVHTRRAGRHRP